MISFYSYLLATLGYGFLAALLLFSWRSSTQGRLLILLSLVSAIWAGFAAVEPAGVVYLVFEILRYIAWYVFLLKLFEPAAEQLVGHRLLRDWGLLLCSGFALFLMMFELGVVYLRPDDLLPGLLSWHFTGHLILAITGLAIIEQLFRNIAPGYRYKLKFLFIGAGAVFAYDFFLYANALLFMGIDPELWAARGFVNLVTVPLLIIAAARNRDWSPNIFVSREIVLHTTTIVAGGLYLLAMAAAGYYLQQFGGSWGRVAQVAFFSLAILLLVVVLFSAQLRRQLQVFLVKHFYRNKYDYRHEWLNLTTALNEKVRDADNMDAAIQVLAQLVNAQAGLLWLDDGSGHYRNVAAWNLPMTDRVVPREDELVRFLAGKSYVVNLPELADRPEEYDGLIEPEWLADIDHAWLIVPLPGLESMPGFILLARPSVVREVNWEDRDLLKTAARQLASHIAVLMTSDALAQVRQFEVFNRLSAYMVHDLKNIAAGLEMVARNAEKHRDNQEFLADAFDSVRSASADIRRLLDQLRNKRIEEERKVRVDLVSLVEGAAGRLAHNRPVPEVDVPPGECHVIVERQRLENVLVHLVENAQQATAEDGFVRIGLQKNDGFCIVAIQDNGHGMDAAFIRDRLFRPFDTTKGNAGMGIGMFESREYIRQLGGDILVSSKPGAGTRVKLEIPLTATA
jgi:putative PEP-CTERM system histidine kinase